jgi:hypothetical protein
VMCGGGRCGDQRARTEQRSERHGSSLVHVIDLAWCPRLSARHWNIRKATAVSIWQVVGQTRQWALAMTMSLSTRLFPKHFLI